MWNWQSLVCGIWTGWSYHQAVGGEWSRASWNPKSLVCPLVQSNETALQATGRTKMPFSIGLLWKMVAWIWWMIWRALDTSHLLLHLESVDPGNLMWGAQELVDLCCVVVAQEGGDLLVVVLEQIWRRKGLHLLQLHEGLPTWIIWEISCHR